MHCAVDVYSQKQGIHFHPQVIQEKPVQFYTHHFAVKLRYELLLKFHPVVDPADGAEAQGNDQDDPDKAIR